MHKMINHTVSLEPVDGSKYTYPKRLPSVYYGAHIKHKYDCERLNIPDGLRIKHDVRCVATGERTTKYIHGLQVENPLLVMKILKDFKPDRVSSSELVELYSKHLVKYGISCSDSYGYIDVGCLTIDGAFLNDISENTDLNIFDVSAEDPQWYSRYASTHIFILY